MSDSLSDSLDGASAVVLGAGGGIGGVITAELLARGCRVTGVDLAFPDAAAPYLRHPGFTAVSADATADATIAAVFDAAAEPPSLLVNCVLYEVVAGLAAATPEHFSRHYAVMTEAAWRWARALVAELNGRSGAIVNVTSVHAHGAIAGYGAYSAAKAALEALTRTMAVEWGPLGVRANAVVPAFVPVLRNRSEQDDPARLARFPLGRYPTAQEVAAATLFLLSGQASAITGVSLPVDSGLLARLP